MIGADWGLYGTYVLRFGLISCCVLLLYLRQDLAASVPSLPSLLQMAWCFSLLYDQMNMAGAKEQKNTGLKFPFHCVFRSPAARRCLFSEPGAAVQSPALLGEVGQHSTEINYFHWQARALSQTDNCTAEMEGGK